MGAKSLKLDSLDLDLENPRITLAANQRDAMQKILNEQKVKLINLAESIAIRGLQPNGSMFGFAFEPSGRKIYRIRGKSACAERKTPE